MEFKQIETFLKVQEYQNMTKAADALFITQSTVSYRLKSLEDELGTQLIARKKGTQMVTVTSQGKQFVPIAKEWMRVYQMTQKFCRSSRILQLRIAAPESIHNYFRETYQLIREEESEVRLTLLTSNSDQVSLLLEQQRADIGFSYLPIEGKGLESVQIGDFPLVVLEWGKQRETYPDIDLRCLDPKKCIMVKGIGFDNKYTTLCLKTWFPEGQDFALTLDSASMLLSNMTEGDWTLLPDHYVDWADQCPEINLYRLKEEDWRLPFYQVMPGQMNGKMERIIKKYF